MRSGNLNLENTEVQDIKREYSYRLLEMQYKSIKTYGIEIERKDLIKGKQVDFISEKVERISPIKEKVIMILEKLKENKVSPIHLIDIIGEEVDNCIFDFNM